MIKVRVRRVYACPQQAMVLHAEINGPYITLHVGANKAFSFFKNLTCHTEHTQAQQQRRA